MAKWWENTRGWRELWSLRSFVRSPVGPDVCMNNKNVCFRVLDFSLHYLYKYVCLLYLQQVCLSLGLFRLVTRMSLDIYLIGQTTLRAMATKWHSTKITGSQYQGSETEIRFSVSVGMFSSAYRRCVRRVGWSVSRAPGAATTIDSTRGWVMCKLPVIRRLTAMAVYVAPLLKKIKRRILWSDVLIKRGCFFYLSHILCCYQVLYWQ